MASERRRLEEARKLAAQHEFLVVERRLQAFEEQTSIQLRQNMDREEELGPTGDPASVRREGTTGHEAVGMRMMRQGQHSRLKRPVISTGREIANASVASAANRRAESSTAVERA
jgi:hypothetical protein